MVRQNVFIFHANLVELTLEGRLIANWVVRPFIITMCFHYKLFVLKIQGHTCSPTLLHVAFIDFGLMGWTSKYLHMNMPQLKTQHNPNFNMQLSDKRQIATLFFDKLPITIIQLTMAHGKTTAINMILQIFCNYNMNGIMIKKK